MQVFYSPKTNKHSPKSFISRGNLIQSPERAERATILKSAAEKAGHRIVEILPQKSQNTLDIHDEGYLRFLQSAWDKWSVLNERSEEIIPNVHPGRNMSASPNAVVSAAGHYQADTACPIGAGTWEGAKASADTVIAAATNLFKRYRDNEPEDFVYSLCRPPGHHAYADQAGGFCFLNNCAIAADYFIKQGLEKVFLLVVPIFLVPDSSMFMSSGPRVLLSFFALPWPRRPCESATRVLLLAGCVGAASREFRVTYGIMHDICNWHAKLSKKRILRARVRTRAATRYFSCFESSLYM